MNTIVDYRRALEPHLKSPVKQLFFSRLHAITTLRNSGAHAGGFPIHIQSIYEALDSTRFLIEAYLNMNEYFNPPTSEELF